MVPIYPSTALKTKQREIKDIAKEQVVHITENGAGAYVFCSEEVFDRVIQDAVEEALYEERVAEGIRAGRADIAAGRCIEGTDAFFETLKSKTSDEGGAHGQPGH